MSGRISPPVLQNIFFMLKTGDVLNDRYTIVKPLGGGAFGTVYSVDDSGSGGIRRALKEVVESSLPPEERDDARELFTRETEILKSLHHRGLPEVVDSFSAGDCHYLVMEYIEGETLETLMKSRPSPFTVQEVLPWAEQLASILDYLHHNVPKPVIFRDLKPSNIMLQPDGTIRLIDFGIARYFTTGKIRDTYFMGTPGFSPPEQYGRGQSDGRSDIFSFGATFFYLLSRADVAQYVKGFPPLGSLVQDVPPWFERVIMKCLAVNPGERYQDAADLLGHIRSEGIESAASASGSAHPSASAWNVWNKAAVGAVVIIAAYLLVLAFPPVIILYVLGGLYLVSRSMGCSTFFSIILIGAGVLFSLIFIIPNFIRARHGNHHSGCKSNLKNLGTALEMYNSDNDGHYPLDLSGVTPMYLKTLPTCPNAGRVTYSYLHTSYPEGYKVWCAGSYHKNQSGVNYPQYDSTQGLHEAPGH